VKISLLIIGMLMAPDALAWGLQTHVFLAQWLLAAAPFADPRIRAAASRLPRLVLAGACLPDVSLFSGWVRDPRLPGMIFLYRVRPVVRTNNSNAVNASYKESDKVY
jgi:hypothetical protein